MKLKWSFNFRAETVRFDKTISYRTEMSPTDLEAMGLRECPEIKIVPEETEGKKVFQKGELSITLAGGDFEDTKDIAIFLARVLQQNIAFRYPKFNLDTSLISCERIPETEQERTELGENRFGMILNLITVAERPIFDPECIKAAKYDPLLDQFNYSYLADSPVDKYIGFFKILESIYGPRKKGTLIESFNSSDELKTIVRKNIFKPDNGGSRSLTDEEMKKFLEDMIQIRHECAHLKENQGFGISYLDPRAREIVEPFVSTVSNIARAALEIRQKNRISDLK